MLLPTLATLLSFTASAAAAALEKRGFAFNAPHYSLYLNDEFSYDSWPGPDKIQPYNRVLMAFWQTNGAQATPASWEGFTDDQRQSILSAYHDAGIGLMVSAFGDDDKVISTKKDPVATAQQLAEWVKKYSVDGVDIDYEDFTPLQSDQANALDWLTKFHNELSTQLPGYAVSSTPTAWMYGSAFGSANSVYCKLAPAVGDKISWYNMQLYNGHPGTWNTCENTFWKSSDSAFLSIKEISDMCGIPQSKITVGKLWSTSDLATAETTADEVPAPADLGACIAQAKANAGYPETGIMIWAAHKDDWNGAIDYLSGAIAGISSAVVSSSASPSSAAVAVANASSAAPVAASSANAGSSGSGSASSAPVVSASSSQSLQASAGTNAQPSSPAGASGAAAASASASKPASGSASSAASGSAVGANASGTAQSGASMTAVAPVAVFAAAAIALLA